MTQTSFLETSLAHLNSLFDVTQNLIRMKNRQVEVAKLHEIFQVFWAKNCFQPPAEVATTDSTVVYRGEQFFFKNKSALTSAEPAL